MPSDLIAKKIKLPRPLPSVLGVGAYLKNVLCLIHGDEARLSRENGSLDAVENVRAFQKTAEEMRNAAQAAPLQAAPVALAHDWHPDFACTRWALEKAAETGAQAVGIQHHHAHIAAIMAEHGLDEPVLGLALDGFGLGERNEAWGGELLWCDGATFRRLGHLRTLPQPGGDVAARQSWRMGAAALWAMGRGDEIAHRYKAFPGALALPTMMERVLNAPLTSSCGRLFDAACGLLGVKPMAAFEGEAPMALERLAADSIRESSRESTPDSAIPPISGKKAENSQTPRHCERSESIQSQAERNLVSCDSGGIRREGAPRNDGLGDSKKESLWRIESGIDSNRDSNHESLVLDLLPLLGLLTGLPAAEGAVLFHRTLAAALLDWVKIAAQQTGIKRVAMGGGCFFNKILRETLTQGMMANGLEPLSPRNLLPGDTAIALGQAYAAALLIEKKGF